MDLLEEDTPGNTPEFTVSELSGAVKRTIEGEFAFVRVRGEIGRVSRPKSGHVYLDLKDDRAVISGVMWKGVAARLAHPPEEGMEVVATGRMTTFPGQSRYQIILEDIQPAGQGALMAMLEKRKAQLQAEGLFESSRKAALPYLPDVIGVVTSPSGAVIRDILHRLRDRFPRKVLVWPVAVQGAGSADQVARGIAGFNAMTPGGALPRPDLIIVARGGGSVEDLWGFNEEVVARAAAASTIPLISAVGHETDTTLIDYVADRRAPTPTAAAELAVPVRSELLALNSDLGARMARAIVQSLQARQQRLRDLARALPRAETLLDAVRQRLDVQSDRLPRALRAQVDRARVSLFDKTGSLRPATLQRAVRVEHARLRDRTARLGPALARSTAMQRQQLHVHSARLAAQDLARDIALGRDRLAGLAHRLQEAQRSRMSEAATRTASLARLLETLSYRGTLARGYAVVRAEGQVVTVKAQAEAAQALEIEFTDGTLRLGGKAPRKVPKSTPSEQGSLF